MRRMKTIVCLLAMLGCLLPAASASASPAALIRDCLLNGKITGHYSHQDYVQALQNLPSYIQEYSDCEAVIRRAMLAQAGGGSAVLALANPAPRVNPLKSATPPEQAAVAQARIRGADPVQIGAATVRPGVAPAKAPSNLPTPLLAASLGFLSLPLAAGMRGVLHLVRSRRR